MFTQSHWFRSFVVFSLFLQYLPVFSQDSATWHVPVDAKPDSFPIFPVKVIHDHNQNIYTLSTWNQTQDTMVAKIYLKKFNDTGKLLWTLVFDDNGNGARGFDMASDGSNTYIAGKISHAITERPLLLKINSNGAIVWKKDSFYRFSSGYLEKIIYKNDILYVGGSGIASIDSDGNEKWSESVSSSVFTVDRFRRMLVCSFDSLGEVLYRFGLGGVKDLHIRINSGRRISSDYQNNIYLLSDLPSYTLEKYDSSGNLEWSRNRFPQAPPFGDIGFEVLVDADQFIYAVGLSDSIYKFDTHGNPIWGRSMHGIDAYRIAADFTANNLLLVAGTFAQGSDYRIRVVSYNYLGILNWTGEYNGHNNQQEFMSDFCISDYDGIYVLENLNQDGRLIKFESFFDSKTDYSKICVERILYDADDSAFVRVYIFNGSNTFISYPSVRIVSPSGDTISNRYKYVQFFGQSGNSIQYYTDSIYVKGIKDFSAYTVLLSTQFSDTTVAIKFCFPSSVNRQATLKENFRVYPNPFKNGFKIACNSDLPTPAVFYLYDHLGKLIHELTFSSAEWLTVELPCGMYYYRILSGNEVLQCGNLVAE